MSFQFFGSIEASKSLFNRALVIGSFFPEFQVQGISKSRDVQLMKEAIRQIAESPGDLNIHCGEAGTVIRFLAFRVSRRRGRHELRGTQRLLNRPMTEIESCLAALGVKTTFGPDRILIEGEGWKRPEAPLEIRRDRSSQFASAILLSAWDLDFDLELEMQGQEISEAYWQMTLALCKQLGMEVFSHGNRSSVPAGQIVKAASYMVEPDYSSSFAIAAFGALYGSASFTNMGSRSLQPDFIFLKVLERMGVFHEGHVFKSTHKLKAADVSLSEAPDLFPILAVLCAFADGKSRLHGAPHLKFKESDRLAKTAELLVKAGVPFEKKPDGLEIVGQGYDFMPKAFTFDPDEDHRMAMAAALLAKRNPEIQILHPDVVDKSFPDFWHQLATADKV